MIQIEMPVEKPFIQLSEEDGNIFFITGRARKIARRAGWSEEQIEAFTKETRASDYDHAIQTVMKYFDWA